MHAVHKLRRVMSVRSKITRPATLEMDSLAGQGAGRKSESGRPALKETGSDHSENLLNMEAKTAAAERVRESGA